MKKNILFLSLSIGTIFSQAQSLLINRQNFNFKVENDTASIAILNGAAIPKHGSNRTWDYSILKPNGDYIQEFIIPTNSAFANSKLSTPSLNDFITPNATYFFDDFRTIDSLGYYLTGVHVPEQHYDLSGFTGMVGDSIIFPNQDDVYASPKYLIKFPATYNDVIESKTVGILKMNLTISAEGLVNAPVERRRHMLQIDSVVGSGNLILPARNGGFSNPTPILLYKRYSVITDSFFMNNIQVPAQILVLFGLKQGSVLNANRYIFWRENSKAPLLVFNTSANYKTISNAFYDSRTMYNVGLEESLNYINKANIYPNPISGNIANIDLLKNDHCDWNLNIYNSIGQLIKNQKIRGIGNLHTPLETNSMKGIYIYQITNQENSTLDYGKIIVE